MSEFWIYVEVGLQHVLSLKAYDHVLFLMALTVAHSFKDWKKILLLVSFFTVGHSLALLFSALTVLPINDELIEFLISITIVTAALFNFFSMGKASKKGSSSPVLLITLLFGIIHGLGFSNYFKSILPGSISEKGLPLLEFAIGIEGAQIIVVLALLLFSYCLQTVFKVSKRDFILVTSAFIIGVVLPLLLENEIWKTQWN